MDGERDRLLAPGDMLEQAEGMRKKKVRVGDDAMEVYVDMVGTCVRMLQQPCLMR